MAYNFAPELSFAEGYYHINFDGNGIVTLDEDTPDDIRERFWKEWAAFHKKVTDLQRKGIFKSCYPILPFEDPIENRVHYETKG